MKTPECDNGKHTSTETSRFDPSSGPFTDTAVLRITRWQRVTLCIKFLCGFLDYFFYEDEEVILKGFRNPATETTYLTYIGEKTPKGET